MLKSRWWGFLLRFTVRMHYSQSHCRPCFFRILLAVIEGEISWVDDNQIITILTIAYGLGPSQVLNASQTYFTYYTYSTPTLYLRALSIFLLLARAFWYNGHTILQRKAMRVLQQSQICWELFTLHTHSQPSRTATITEVSTAAQMNEIHVYYTHAQSPWVTMAIYFVRQMESKIRKIM